MTAMRTRLRQGGYPVREESYNDGIGSEFDPEFDPEGMKSQSGGDFTRKKLGSLLNFGDALAKTGITRTIHGQLDALVPG